jgi:hypothetical protein
MNKASSIKTTQQTQREGSVIDVKGLAIFRLPKKTPRIRILMQEAKPFPPSQHTQ